MLSQLNVFFSHKVYDPQLYKKKRQNGNVPGENQPKPRRSLASSCQIMAKSNRSDTNGIVHHMTYTLSLPEHWYWPVLGKYIAEDHLKHWTCNYHRVNRVHVKIPFSSTCVVSRVTTCGGSANATQPAKVASGTTGGCSSSLKGT